MTELETLQQKVASLEKIVNFLIHQHLKLAANFHNEEPHKVAEYFYRGYDIDRNKTQRNIKEALEHIDKMRTLG